MENFELKDIQNIECDNDFILKNLKLVDAKELGPNNFLKLKPGALSGKIDAKYLEKTPLDDSNGFLEHFENIKIIEPDKICRPKGDTTFFTVAGVQHIETILRRDGKLKKEQFMIAQPVIRSQFMDKVKDGTSTSFVNFSIESIDATPAEFIELSNKFIQLVVNQGVKPEELRLQVEELPDRWGDKKFNKTVLTFYFNNIELGECIYMHDYPVTENKKINIVDIGFGVERLNWGIGNNKNYLPGFDEFYTDKIDSNKVTALIDSIRTATLIAAEGVKSSNHDQGYRLRQLLKRFVSRNQETKFDISELVRVSYEYWGKWNFQPNINESDVVEIIKQEAERNWNSLFLSALEEGGGPHIYIDINQTTTDFLKQINVSLSKETREIVNEVIKKIK